MEGTFEINGKDVTLAFRSDAALLETLRDNGFTEVKDGCKEGSCGACVVILDGKLVSSCQVFAASAIGKKITTVRGIGDIHHPHPIQTALVETGGVQCGYCTPGKVLAAYHLLSKNVNPTQEEIRKALDGVLCRCTGYVKITEGVTLAASRMRKHD